MEAAARMRSNTDRGAEEQIVPIGRSIGGAVLCSHSAVYLIAL
jgi:hypothetical protein